MKCDELESFTAETFGDGKCEVYDADEVDAAIAELKEFAEDACLERDDNQTAIDELRAENAELKQKLESVQASAYAESVDAGMRERRLKRALWMARAERAKEMCRRLLIQGFDPKWENVERKCRAKAKEYK